MAEANALDGLKQEPEQCENLPVEESAGGVQFDLRWRSRSGGEEGPMDRLDEEKLEMLRTWGEGLLNDGRDELRAAGRAIMMLVEEIELLHVDLWHARQHTAKEAELQPEADSRESRSQLGLALQRRISALRGRGVSGSAEE